MPSTIFQCDPARFARDFARDGFVHIRSGVTEEFLSLLSRQADERVLAGAPGTFAVGEKLQAVYEFPGDGGHFEELRATVGALCGLDPRALVLSERHFKAYEASAASAPRAHKDRFASEISLGITVRAPNGSTLVLYPYDELEVNPFNASDLLRASLPPDRQPEPALRKARRVEIDDAPGDIVLFRGHRMWHHRSSPATTVMLYLKFNAMNCDPLGEDPSTPAVRSASEAAAAFDDGRLEACIPMIGRRVDYLHRFYNRNWQEVTGVVLWGGTHWTMDELEWKTLRATDGTRSVGALLGSLNGAVSREAGLAKIRLLARRGVLDLVEPVAQT